MGRRGDRDELRRRVDAGRPGGRHDRREPLLQELLAQVPRVQEDMVGQHELAELAPRDVVAKGIHRQMLATGADHVFLDARHVDRVTERFPTITAYCRTAGVDPSTDLIPVAPAAHYASGGVRTDLFGRTSIPGLYACGEVACTGVHGANRLASNSLLEGLVFSKRIATDIAKEQPPQGEPILSEDVPAPVTDNEDGPRAELQTAMTRGAGVLRSAGSLADTRATLEKLAAAPGKRGKAGWELTNLLTVASALVSAASIREETRGCHWREDFPQAEESWRGHLLADLADGAVTDRWEPLT
jgi:L-aspartate oxidase